MLRPRFLKILFFFLIFLAFLFPAIAWWGTRSWCFCSLRSTSDPCHSWHCILVLPFLLPSIPPQWSLTPPDFNGSRSAYGTSWFHLALAFVRCIFFLIYLTWCIIEKLLEIEGYVLLWREFMSQGGGGGGSPPDSALHISFDSTTSSFPMKSVTMTSSSSQSSAIGASASGIGINVSTDAKQFSHDISRMSDFPTRNISHRRALSEILSLPDDISFDSDLGVVGCMDGPSLFDDTEDDFFSMYIDLEKLNTSAGTSGKILQVGDPSGAATPLAPQQHTENLASSLNDKPKFRHQHSCSMDSTTSVKSELLASGLEIPSHADTKKAMSAAKLADLALVDPKRAKRIWANRQSAARSKERKMRYIGELERKVKTLQTEATTLSAQLTILQRDINGLSAENSELKLRLQTIEQQVHLQDALNDAMREEVQLLKLATGQITPNASMMNFGPSFGSNQQFYDHNQAMQSLIAAHQLKQLQIHSHHQQQLLPYRHQQQQPLPAEDKMKGTIASSQNPRERIYDTNNSHKE